MAKSTNINLVDLIAERIKSSPLGDLITEADLYDVVSQGIERAFFTSRVENAGSYPSKTLPPLIVEVMQAALKDAMKDAANKWVIENSEKLANQMKKVMDDGIVKTADAIMEARVREAQRPTMQAVVTAINGEREKLGLAQLSVFF